MMHIDILTVVPELLEGPFSHSILKRAQQKELLDIQVINLRDYTPYKHKQVDDYQYGGGAGMVLMPEPSSLAIEALQEERSYDEILLLAPARQPLKHCSANQRSLEKDLRVRRGQYQGVDERVRKKYVSNEVPVGDVVLAGGEWGAAGWVGAIGGLIAGVL